MNKDLEDQLLAAFPIIFQKMKPRFGQQYPEMTVQCRDGWFNLIWTMAQKLEPIAASTVVCSICSRPESEHPFQGSMPATSNYDFVYPLPDQLPCDNFTPDHPHISQIKQKFGGLRVYCNHAPPSFDDIIDNASLSASSTCESCGSPGTIRNINHWLQSVCDNCSNQSDD